MFHQQKVNPVRQSLKALRAKSGQKLILKLKKYFVYHNLQATVEIGNVEQLHYSDDSFDVVVARQILMFTPDTQKAVNEIFRILKPCGKVIALLHNKNSWYALLGNVTGTNLIAEAKEPPINKLYSIKEAKKMFENFSSISIFLDKFPSKTNRRNGIFAQLYNNLFIPLTEIIPRALIRPFGWYIIIKAIK